MPVPDCASAADGGRIRSPLAILAIWMWRLVAVLATIAVLGIFASTLGPRVLPYRVYTALSGSMEPAVPFGSVIILRPVSADRIAAGDIIAFRRPDRTAQLVTHRVVGIEDGAEGSVFITKGDANPVPDAWRIPATGDGWRYVFGIPYLGYVLAAISSPFGRSALLLAPLLAAALLILIRMWLPRRRLDSANSGIIGVGGDGAFSTQEDADHAPDARRVAAVGSGRRRAFGVSSLGCALVGTASRLGRIAPVLAPLLAVVLLILVQTWPRRGRPDSLDSI
jgi:signal peptidase